MEEQNYAFSYIAELRKRLIAVAIFFAAALVIGMLFSKRLVVLFLNSNLPANVNLVTLNPYENISLFIHFMFFVAITLTIPFLIYQIIGYVKPSLTKKERNAVIIFPFIAFTLFIIGAGFGFFITKNIIVPFLSNLALSIGIVNNWSIDQFMGFVVYLSLIMGVIFQMPLLTYLLVKFNVLKPKQIKRFRKHVIIALIVLAAIITPPDAFSLIIMVIPLILLFEISIFITRFIKTKEILKNQQTSDVERPFSRNGNSGFLGPPRKNSEVKK